ncbi:MAG: hypothetical protein WDM77_14420 [Steroidobacteraceae bacterium]
MHTGIASFARLLPLPVVEFSHLAGSAIGLALLILARALFRRIHAAYHITFWLLLIGGVIALLKGGIFKETLFLWVVLGMLVLGRSSFYRPASLLQQRFTPTWAASIVGVIAASVWVGCWSTGISSTPTSCGGPLRSTPMRRACCAPRCWCAC